MTDTALKSLRSRWTSAEVSALRGQLRRASQTTAGPHRLAPSWQGPNDEATDLRGLQAGSLGVEIAHLLLRDVDASGMEGGLTVRDSTLERCRLDQAKLTASTRLEGRLRSCSFRGASIPQASIGPEVVDGDFSAAKLRRLRAVPGTVFTRCAFDGAELSGAEFTNTRFVDCSFDGARFNAATVFRGCTFVGEAPKFGMANASNTTHEPR